MLKRPDRRDRCLCEEAKDDGVVSGPGLIRWSTHRTAEDSAPFKCNVTRFYLLWVIDEQGFCLYALDFDVQQ